MSHWLHYLELKVKARFGLTSTALVWAVVAAIGAAITFGFIVLTIGIWIAERYSPMTSAVVLGAVFLTLTVVAVFSCISEHKRTMEEAKQALALKSNIPWATPQTLATGLQIGRAVGWRKILPLLAIGVVATGVTREWIKRNPTMRQIDERRDA